jgi:hypothetical protein
MSDKNVNPGTHQIKGLNECNDIPPLQEDRNIDPPPKQCDFDPNNPTLRQTASRPDMGWLSEAADKQVGLGSSGLCDPMQTGQINEDPANPNRDYVYRYPKAIRATNEAMMDLFSNITVTDNQTGKISRVPILWSTQERAVQYILSDNMRKDDSLVVDRVRLPIMAIHSTDHQFDQTRYIYHKAVNYMESSRSDGKPGFTVSEKYDRDTVFGVARGLPMNISYNLLVWTMYMSVMDKIEEQIILKFSPVAYINVRGVQWEVIVSLDSIANNVTYEPGDQKLRIVKYQFNMTAQTYIPQPIVRKKAVLKTRVDVHNDIEPEDITETLGRLEQAVEELENND